MDADRQQHGRPIISVGMSPNIGHKAKGRMMSELEDTTPATTITPDPPAPQSETVSRVDFEAQQRDATKYHRQRQEKEKEIDELKTRVLSPENMEKFQALLEREEEDRKAAEEAEVQRLAERGEFETVIKKHKVESATQIQQLKDSKAEAIAERDDALGKMKRQLMNSAAEAPLRAAMGELAMRQTESAIRLIQDGHTRWDDLEGTDWFIGCQEQPNADGSTRMVPVVFDRANEDAVVMKEGSPISIKEFVAKFAASPEGRMRLPAVADDGTGSHAGTSLHGEINWTTLEHNNELRWKMQTEDPDRYAKLHHEHMQRQNRQEDADQRPTTAMVGGKPPR